MAPPQTEVADIWLQFTTYLSTPKGWKAELAWLADLQRAVYPHKWSPVSCRSSACRTAKARRSKTNVLPLYRATNHKVSEPYISEYRSQRIVWRDVSPRTETPRTIGGWISGGRLSYLRCEQRAPVPVWRHTRLALMLMRGVDEGRAYYGNHSRIHSETRCARRQHSSAETNHFAETSTEIHPGFESRFPDRTDLSPVSAESLPNVVDSFSCRHQSLYRVSWKSAGDCVRSRVLKIQYSAVVREEE